MSYKEGDWVEVIAEGTNDFGEVLKVEAVDSSGVYVEGVMGWTVYPEEDVVAASAEDSAGPFIRLHTSKQGEEYIYLDDEQVSDLKGLIDRMIQDKLLPATTVYEETFEEDEEDV